MQFALVLQCDYGKLANVSWVLLGMFGSFSRTMVGQVGRIEFSGEADGQDGV